MKKKVATLFSLVLLALSTACEPPWLASSDDLGGPDALCGGPASPTCQP